MAVGQWAIDYTVKMPGYCGFSGGAPAGHHRRCQAANRRGTQCAHFARVGSHYCDHHGGALRLRSSRVSAAGAYARRAGTRLRAMLAEVQAQQQERMDLAGEIDLARCAVLEALQLQAAVESAEDLGKASDGALASMKGQVQAMLRAAVEHVTATVKVASQVNAAQAATASLRDLHAVVSQLQRVLVEEVQDEELRERVLRRLDNVRLAAPRLVVEVA